MQYLIPSDVAVLDFYKDFYTIYFTTPIEKPALFYNFTTLRKHKSVSLVLTSTRRMESWGYGFKAFIWNEREAIEMSGVKLKRLKDARNLLLDYGYYDRPLLKKNKLTKDNTLYYSRYHKKILMSGQNRPSI